MKILKIKPENIKSYENGPIVELHPGVNFISGKNGSGKTTLLESISYAIFDYSPYSNILKMVRDGFTKGKMTVWFSFDDDIVYRSERKIGTGARTWTIYEEGDETEIVSGAKETKEWIREKIGVPEDMDISKMYSDIIGVSQGEITTYFKISSETKRKDHFNPIIGVEDYREAFKRTSTIPSNIQLRIKDIISQIDQIKAKTEKYDEKKGELNKLKKELEKIQKEAVEKKKEFELKEKQLGVTENIRERLKELEKKISIVEESIKNEAEQVKKLKNEVSNSQKACLVIKKTKKGYEEYKTASEKSSEVENKRKRKKELEEEKNSLLTEIKSSEREVQANKKNSEKNERTKKEKIRIEKKKISAIDGPYQKTVLELKKVEEDIILIRKADEEDREELKEILDNLKQNHTKIKGNETQINKKNLKIKNLKKELKGLEEFDRIKDKISEFKKLIQTKETSKGSILQNIESYNQSISKGGVCPILNESCKRISKDILSDKIEHLEKEKEKIETEIEPIKKELSEYEKEIEKLVKLGGKRDQIEEEEKEISELKDDIKELKSEIKLGDVNSLLKQIKSTFATLNVSIEINEIKSTKTIQEELSSTLKTIKEHIKEVNKTKNKKKIEIEKNRVGYETKVTKSKENIQELESELQDIETDKLNIKQKEEEVAIKKEELSKIKEKLKPLSNIEKELGRLRGLIEKNEQKYSNYNKNIKEAEKIGERKAQLSQISESLKNDRKFKSNTKKEISALKPKFKEGAYKNLKETVNKLREEKTKVESKLGEFERNNKELLKELREMEREMEKIEKLDKDKNVLEETNKLVEFIRKILNTVGKPIAQRYLDTISASANMIYNTLSDEKVELSWEQDYMVRVKDHKGTREFRQLSGGEQMCVALSIQLALAKEFSNVGIAIFDEPTSNLDETRCDFLADTIGKVKEEYGFNQLFIISHDETFSSLTEQEIHLEKVKGKTNLA